MVSSLCLRHFKIWFRIMTDVHDSITKKSTPMKRLVQKGNKFTIYSFYDLFSAFPQFDFASHRGADYRSSQHLVVYHECWELSLINSLFYLFIWARLQKELLPPCQACMNEMSREECTCICFKILCLTLLSLLHRGAFVHSMHCFHLQKGQTTNLLIG